MTSKEDKILIKYIATRKEVWYEEIACRVPNEYWPLTTLTVKRKIDDIGTVNRQLGSGRKRKVIIEQKHSIISVKFC